MKDDLEFIDIDLDSSDVYSSTSHTPATKNVSATKINHNATITVKKTHDVISDDIEYLDSIDSGDLEYSYDVDTDTDTEDDDEHDEQDEKKHRRRISILKEAASYVLVVLAAFILASLTNRFLIVNARIPTGSMIPTIMEGDRIIGNRIAYMSSEPERGDIIVFYYPDNENEKYVKRIIGLPGETVYIADGLVYIDGQPLDESDYLTVTTAGVSGPFVVPEDCYFVMGDNRNSSWDSRFWRNTFVHKDKIIAKAEFCYYPKPHWVR